MDKASQIKVVGRMKASELLGCKSTDFYNLHYKKLLETSVFGKDGRKRLYLLDEVMKLKKEIDDIDDNYEIIK